MVVGLIPWLITRWQFHQPLPGWIVAQVLGAVLVIAGLVVLDAPYRAAYTQ